MEASAIDFVVAGLLDTIRKNSTVDIEQIYQQDCKEAIEKYLADVIAAFVIHSKYLVEN